MKHFFSCMCSLARPLCESFKFIVETVVFNRNYCFVIEVLFYLNVVRIKEVLVVQYIHYTYLLLLDDLS